MKTILSHGVPYKVQMDGWWINKANGPRKSLWLRKEIAGNPNLRIGALLALLALADQMIWQVSPGISLAVFGGAVLVMAYAMVGQKGAGGIAAGTLLLLPVVEQVQTLSVMFWLLGMAFGAGWIALSAWPGFGRSVVAALRFCQYAPWQPFKDIRGIAIGSPENINARSVCSGWALPLGLGLVFVGLLLRANPMIEGWFEAVFDLGWLDGLDADRMVFWAIMAFFTWPFLRLSAMRERLKLPFGVRKQRVTVAKPGLINAASVRRSLVLFNIVFAFQTVMDVAYLWGGAALPDGMNYAEYAHRGAYPLVATALLAGLFAVASRPYVENNKLLKAGLLLWVVQTILMVLSSVYRLELYVETYGMTRLRLAAFIWMGVVSVGLGMVIWQVVRGHNAAWLMARAGVIGLVTLYGASFHSFDRHIAWYNLTHDVRPDVYYLCGLGAAALPEIRKHERIIGQKFCHSDEPRAPKFADWREWGFREWRVQRNLAKINKQRWHP